MATLHRLPDLGRDPLYAVEMRRRSAASKKAWRTRKRMAAARAEMTQELPPEATCDR